MNSGLGIAKNTEKQPEVLRELEYLEKACTQLHDAIESVEVRFAAALTRTPGTAPFDQNKELAGYSCALAEYIATHRKRVEDAAHRLDDLRRRCEL